jgi:hypothetical protein
MSSRATKCAAREEETAGFCFTDLHLRTTTGAGRSRSDAARAPSRRVARSRRAFERGFGREDAEAGGVVARYRASGCPARASTGDGAEAERRGAAAFGIRRLGSPRLEVAAPAREQSESELVARRTWRGKEPRRTPTARRRIATIARALASPPRARARRIPDRIGLRPRAAARDRLGTTRSRRARANAIERRRQRRCRFVRPSSV